VNNTPAQYLCDTGADETIISEKLFNKMTRDGSNAKLKEYEGNINRGSGQLNILGEVQVERMIIDPELPEKLDKTSLVVATHKSKNDVLLGRDIMEQIPKFKNLLDQNRSFVNEMSSIIQDKFLNESPVIQPEKDYEVTMVLCK
jgi:hypothetical protein